MAEEQRRETAKVVSGSIFMLAIRASSLRRCTKSKIPTIKRRRTYTTVAHPKPTGTAHLGNYLGAIRQWVDLQGTLPQDKLIFSIVDLHCLTTNNDPKALKESVLGMVAIFLACGLDPAKCIMYNQSRVSGHSELNWLFSCITSMGLLNTMTQYKEKKENKGEMCGLLTYPVLMAADILLFKATHVPVGEDQVQHMELTRQICNKFNNMYDTKLFPVPQTVLTPAKRIMNLKDSSKKMSKSEALDATRINLTDDSTTIQSKILKAKTDMTMGVTYDPINRPEVANLVDIFTTISGRTTQDICEEYASKDMLVFKKAIIEVLVEHFRPITTNLLKYNQDPAYLLSVLDQGSSLARAQAEVTLKEVREVVGLI